MSEFRILEGDCLTRLADLPDRSVQTCVTSPPYWGLRDYGSEGQLGLEPTPEQYVENMVAVFREVRRVLRDDGTLWLNLGDSYAGSGPNRHGDGVGASGENNGAGLDTRNAPPGLKPKDLVGIPWMVAFALRADGWYLRSDIVWNKLNPMPESVTDRPTKAHEYLFMLTKGPRYFYDADAIREAQEGIKNRPDWARAREVENRDGTKHDGRKDYGKGLMQRWLADPSKFERGRNKRSVWTVATQPFPGAHFATFPPKLIEPCILAGSPPKCCGECGAPWERVRERTGRMIQQQNGPGTVKAHHEANGAHGATSSLTTGYSPEYATTGWRSTCDHDDDSGAATVLDPFNGAGTTGLVALRHDRDYIGIELNPEYAQMARDRILDDAPLLNMEAA